MNPTEGQRSRAAAATGAVDRSAAIRRLLPEKGGRDRLLPLLHAVQAHFGYVDDAIVPEIADTLNISRADVQGVLTFYYDFRRTPPGRNVVRVCRAESCRARGAMAVERAILDGTGGEMGGTTADGRVTVDRVHCFGLCAVGPNVMINGRIRSRLDAAGVVAILEEVTR